MRWFTLIIGCLATFRLSQLVSKERGPLAIVGRIGKSCGRPGIGEGVAYLHLLLLADRLLPGECRVVAARVLFLGIFERLAQRMPLLTN
jgi:hypothetical protein